MSIRFVIHSILVMIAFAALATIQWVARVRADATVAWSYRRPITITNTLGGELRDYQVKVTLDASNFDFDRAQPSGADLRFTDQSGTRYIAHWVERFDSQAKQATVWVKTPQLPASGVQTVYAYYGNPAAENLSSGGRAFEMFDDFGQPGLGYYEFSPATTVMTQTEPWETKPPHTLSVVELNRDGYKYWGYYGLTDCGGIGLARSNDLLTWDKSPQPLLNQDGERWPSVQRIGDTIYMIYDRDYCGTSQLVLRTSTDGLTFDPAYKVIVPQEAGIRNQNPALFRDPKDGRFYLYWYRGGSETGFWQIRMRSADSVEGLADPASEKILLDVPYELAAPNMMAYDGVYFLSTEVNENAWKTKIYTGVSPSGPFAPLPDAPQLSDNQACLFQHVMTTTMQGYLCKDTGAGWVLNHRSADLSKGRNAQRLLDPGVWTNVQGAWQPIESDPDQAGRSGIVLRGRGQRAILKTALPGGDYVFSVSGRFLDNEAWGVAVRVQDADNYYVVKLQRAGIVRIEKVVDGTSALMAETRLIAFDREGWHTLTVNVFGKRIEASLDEQLAGQALDSSSTWLSGNSALIVDFGDAQFDDVVWRKYAAAEPTASVGAREDRDESKTNWLTIRPTSAAAISSAVSIQGVNMPTSFSTGPVFTTIAALATVLAIAIMLAGFLRNRR